MRIPRRVPRIGDILQEVEGDRITEILLEGGMGPAPGGRYYHWEELRRRPPPEGFSPEEWWLGIKLSRRQGRRLLPFADLASGRPGRVPSGGYEDGRAQREDR